MIAVGGGYGEEVVARVRDRVDIVGLIGEYVQLRKAGKNFVGLCPFHQERTPSFSVSPDKQMFYCFGCQAGGDVFNFLMKKENLTFPEALELLARRAGVPLPRAADPEARRREGERASLLEALEAAAQHFVQGLAGPDGARARAYLEQRGIGAAAVQQFRLGYAPPAWGGLIESLGRRGFKPPLLERAGLALRQTDGGWRDRFRDRLMFPIADPRGRVIGFGGRALDEANQPKYLNSPETPVFAKRRAWYGLDRARAEIGRREQAVVVEGYLDLITAHQAGFTNVVASLGTALTPEQAMALSRLAPRVVIAYDPDAAGAAATLRGLELFPRFGARVLVAVLPRGLDPDALIRERGKEAFADAVERALPLMEYRLQLEVESRDLGTVEGRVAAVRAIVPVLAGMEDAVEREGYLALAAARLGVSEEALRADVARYLRRAPSGAAADRMAAGRNNIIGKQIIEDFASGASSAVAVSEVAAARAREAGPQARAEREVLRLMLQDEALARSLRPVLVPQDFASPHHRQVAEALFRVLDSPDPAGAGVGGYGPPAGRADAGGGAGRVEAGTAVAADLAVRVARVLGEEGAALVSGLALAGGEGYADAAGAAAALVRRLKEQRLKARIEGLRQAIAEGERRGQQPGPEVLAELQALLQQLKGSRGAAGRGESGG
ncbi:MAG: DNA primase [Acetobacteraceae bacterium]|nr:DNA primase [Acetobacteraceae bacterium]